MKKTPKSYANLLNRFAKTPWAILPEKLAEIKQILVAHVAGEEIEAEAWTPERQAFEARVAEARAASGNGIAVLPIFGIISHRMNLMTQMSGGTSIEKFMKEFRAAMADQSIGTIVMDMESPGGTVFGTPEAADEIFAARAQKRIVAVADTYAASGAYWLATAAEEISVMPSGQVGSIGVYTVHDDFSKRLEMEGIKTTYISAGKFKTEGNPDQPLTEEARAAIQAEVDAYYEIFIKAVARGRGVKPSEVRAGFGEGRMVLAKDAIKMGMADRIETFDEALSRLAGSRSRSRASAQNPAVEIEQMEARLRLQELS